MSWTRKCTTVYIYGIQYSTYMCSDVCGKDVHITSSLPTKLNYSCPYYIYINCFHDLLSGAKHKPCMTLFQHFIDPSHEAQALGRLVQATWAGHHVSQSRQVSCNVVFTYNLDNTL